MIQKEVYKKIYPQTVAPLIFFMYNQNENIFERHKAKTAVF